MKHWVYILIALLGWGLARVSLAEKNAPVTFTMQSLEPGQRDELVRYETGAGGKWSGSCEGSVEETWSGITYYSPSNCTGDYQTRASRVGARPGFRFDKFFLFRALISHRQMNIMSSGGNCPGSETYNFLLLRGRNKDDYVLPMDYSSPSTFAAGTFTYDSSNITGVSRFSLESLSPVLSSENAFSYEPVSDTCASGALVSKASDFTDMPLGKYPSWVFGDSLAVSIEGGTNPIMTVAVPQSALSTASSFWANKNKNVYSGLMTHFTGRGSQEQKNIYLTPSDSTGRVFSLSEASGAGALNDTSLRASLGSINCSTLNSPSPGFCSGTLAFTGSDNTGNAVCLFSFSNNGKDLLFCAAQSPSDSSRLITFLAGTSAVTKLEVQASPLHLSANQESGVVNVTVTNLTSRPALSLNPDSLLGSEKLLAPFTPLTNASLTGSFTPGGFVTGNTCGTYLPAYSTCQIQIAYAPAALGLHKQVFRLPYDKKQSISQNAITQILASRGLSSLQIIAPDFTVGSAASAQVIATYGEGETQQTQDVTALVNCNADIGCIPIVEGYSTSNNQAILVSSSGTLTSSQAGSATITARAGSFTASTTVTAYAGAPEPINVTITATNYSQIDLSWTSGGEGTSAFQIAYQAGETAPATCSTGTVITAATQGLATTKSILGLTANTQYSFRVCATNGAGTLTSGVTASVTTPAGVVACAGDCYADSAATTAGAAWGPGDVEMEYVFANGSGGFKIWKEKGGSRILNATGLIANGWQKELARAGTAFSGTDFTMESHIAGRVCPTHVFLSHSNMTATGRCLYYDGGNVAQALDAAGTSGTEASDWLQDWSLPATGPAESGTSSSYYEGNISTCAEKGMRLPTMYETTMTKPGDYLPIGDGIDSWDISSASYVQNFSVASEEATPQDVFFKPDGTKLYVIGNSSNKVNEYNLSSAWDASTASYVQSFSVAAQEIVPTGIFFKPDGTKLYVIGNNSDKVNEYNLGSAWDVSTASYMQNFSVAAQENNPTGIFFKPDGTKIYVIGNTGDDVNEYNLSSAWDVSSASYVKNFSIAAQETIPHAIFFKPDGTKMYVMGSTGDDVNEYNLSSAWDVSTASYAQVFSVAASETLPTGVFFNSDGTKMYVVGNSSKEVNEYNLSSAWDVSTCRNGSVASEEATPQDIFFKPDGTKLYVIGNNSDKVNEYNLSSAWDASTASYVQNFSLAAQETNPTGIFIKPDGTKMYVIGHSGDDVNEYNLSSAWDVSTASYVQVFSVAAQETVPTGIFFKPDGTKMYVIGHSGDDVNEYNLGSAWDVSTASYVQVFSVAAQETMPHAITFKPDGTKMYVIGSSGDDVNEYNLSSAWDVSTASYVQVFSVAAQETLPTGLFFKSGGGTKLYVIGHGQERVIQYGLLPSNGKIVPLWAGSTDGVPRVDTSWTWTASANTGSTYYYWAWLGTASNGLSYLGSRSVRCVLPDNGPYVPDAPTAVTGIAGPAEVTLAWTEPNDGEDAIIDYVIEYSTDGGKTWAMFSDGISASTSLTITGLTNGTSYVFRVAAKNSVGTGIYSSNSASIAPVPVACNGDCYIGAQSLPIGTERQGPGNSILTLQYANGTDGFKIWKMRGSSRILNATGLVENGWQKELNSAGTEFANSNFTSGSEIAGRVCPPNVFLDYTNMTATGRCLYYDAGNPAARLAGVWNGSTTGRGSSSSYYERNIGTCTNKGMRLPTAYETTMTPPTGWLPTGDGITPVWAGSGNATFTQSFSVSRAEVDVPLINPTGIFFKPDGTKMYAIDLTNRKVNEYNLTTAWDVSTASYVRSLNVAGAESTPQELFFNPDGTKMYVIGSSGDDVNEYNLSSAWDVSSASYVQVFSVATQEANPSGIFFKPDGTKMYVIGHSGDDVNEYNLSSAWDVSSASYVQVFSVATQEANPSGIFFKPDGTKMYVIGSTGDDVNEYNLSSAWDVSTASYVQVFSVAAQEIGPTGIFFHSDGTKMYVIGSTGDDVNEYNLSSAWDISTASYARDFVQVSPTGIFFKPDGTKMYVLGSGGDGVNEYNLTTAWDVLTASYVQVFSVAAQETVPTGIFFKPDGTKMYVIGSSGGDVNEYNLSSAWDVSSASHVKNFSVASEEATPNSIFFKPDGTKMYVIGHSGDDVNEYNLGTAWDVSTASYVQVFSVVAEENSPTGIFFKPDGTKMYVLGSGGDGVNEYNLTTAWDVSTASYVQVFSVAAQETGPTGIFFKPDGTKMYVIGASLNDANEYNLETEWQLISPDGVPSYSSATWTASAYTASTGYYWTWSVTSSNDQAYDYPNYVRCVLP